MNSGLGINISSKCFDIPIKNDLDWESKLLLLIKMGEANPKLPLGIVTRYWKNNQPKQLESYLAAVEDNFDKNEIIELQTTPITTYKYVQPNEVVHIYIDYSNITAGFEHIHGSHPINPQGLANFLEEGRYCMDKQIAGSFPHAGHDIWKVWNQLGYRTKIGGTGKEQFVDDFLHAQIFRLLLQIQKNDAHKHVIVLVTGDGNNNDNYTSFVECVLHAAALDFRVEICSWKQRLNKVYLDIVAKYPKLVSIKYLDMSKHSILIP